VSLRRLLAGALLACALAASHAGATTITLVNLDGAGEGFNDPHARAPVGGNPGTMLGQQRLNVFLFALDTWEALVDSGVEIRVGAQFAALSCNSMSALLGSAGPETVFRDFAGAPQAGTWYPVALANSLAGTDLDPGGDHIGAAFSSTIDDGCLSGVSGWYYGLDGNAPPNQIELLATVLHELAHGLGFLTLVNLSTGQKFFGFDDAYMLNLEDHSTGQLFPTMTNAERLTAMVDTGDLHWVGANVVATSGVLSSGAHPSGHVEVFAPSPAQPGSSVSHWSTSLSPDEVMEPFATATSIIPLTVALMEDIGYTIACGDGAVAGGEGCDDGNNLEGDGCGRACVVEPCWACAGSPSVCAPVADGTGCSDQNTCTGPDTCQAGVCQAGPPTGAACDDGNPCTESDACVGTTCGGSFPLSSCIAPDVPGRAFVQLTDDTTNDTRDAVLWRWIRGTTLAPAFGSPTTVTPYTLCVQDAVDGSLMSLFVPPGINWRQTNSGFVYTDSSLLNDGVKKIVLRAGTGNAKILVRGKGPLLDMADLTALDLPLTVQMTNGMTCWEATYQSNVILNDPDRFKAKAD
jgi:cysteine-rich repeat protein